MSNMNFYFEQIIKKLKRMQKNKYDIICCL